MALLHFVPLLAVVLLETAVAGCAHSDMDARPAQFDSIPVVHTVAPLIAETSGLADSRRNKGFLWVHEDSNNPAQLYLLGHDGKVAKTVALSSLVNHDWEELQLSGDSLYLGDIGDNGLQRDAYGIHIFKEPSFQADNVTGIRTIPFMYADGPRDAEAFLVDGQTKDIFIITKSDKPSRIYRLAFPYHTGVLNKATFVAELPYMGVVGAALSPDGSEIILKTYGDLRLYRRSPGASLAQTLQKPFEMLPYRTEPQGEAVAFAADNSGYFTLSEKSIFFSVKLYYYRRQ